MSKPNENHNTKMIFTIAIIVLIIGIVIFLLMKGCTKTPEYLVTFDVDGGSAIESVTVKENDRIDKPVNPTKEGYQFAGWYYEDKLFDFDTKITKDITLKAHWSLDEIELDLSKMNLKVDETAKLDILSLPEGLSEDDLEYVSSDESIATVDKDGNIIGLKSGVVTITVRSKDGKYQASCTVTVTEEPKPTPTPTETPAPTKKPSSRPSNPTPTPTPVPPTPTPIPDPVYKVILTAIHQELTGGVMQYTFEVQKDGTTFSDYVGFIYNGKEVHKNAGTVAADSVNTGVGNAQVCFTAGNCVNATVEYR